MQISSIRHAWPEKAKFSINRPHGHSEYTFLHFFGSVELLINGRKISTRPHACILFAPGTPQWFKSHTPLVHDWFHFSVEEAPACICCDTVYYPNDAGFITDIVQEMESEISAGRSDFEQLVSAKAIELFIKLGRSTKGEDPVPVNSSAALQLSRLRQTMLTHLSEPWTVERMAKTVNLSVSRFYYLYRSIYGRSPMNDLIHARIEAAKTALSFGNESLSELAERLGYSNITHFSRQFHALVGTPPGAYRQSRQR